MVDLANYLFRALALLGLAVAPRLLSPDPATPKNVAVALLVSVIGLGGLLGGAYAFRNWIDSREARIGAALVWISVAASIGGAIYLTGPEAPLQRGAWPLAILVWAALAAIAAALAGRFLGSNWKQKRTAATALVMAGGILIHADAAKNAGNRDHQWKIGLDRDPTNESAFQHVMQRALEQGKLKDATKRVDACLAASPDSCTCLIGRLTLAQRHGVPEKAVAAGFEAAKRCPDKTAARAPYAEALANAGKLTEALAEADAAVELNDDPARAHAARAYVLLRSGKPEEAEEEAQKATSSAGGRESAMAIAAMKISSGDLDGAEGLLRPLVAQNPQDSDAVYNLALIADKRGKYNDARNGYLAALKINPKYKEARYNLAMLTWRRGVVEEAKNHARKFAEIAPNDPSAQKLLEMTGATRTPDPK